MLVITRYSVPVEDGQDFLDRARVALDAFAACAGSLGGAVGRSTDDPTLWALTLRWDSIGAYRRALSSYEVKVSAVPLMYQAIDEPSAFEVLAEGDESAPTRRAADAGVVAVGEASQADVPRDLR